MVLKNKNNLGKQSDGSPVQKLVEELITNKALKPKSLISTIFGDLAAPYGGLVWIESLISLLAPLGISDRLVRTSLFRLVEDGWLVGTRSGRKSYYGLTDLGASQTRLAESLIYHRSNTPWDNNWTMVFLVMNPIDIDDKNQLEQELKWIGFGRISNHVWCHPTVATDLVLERVGELNLLDKVVCMKCENIQRNDDRLEIDDRDLAISCMPIADTEVEYQTYIERFDGFSIVLDSLNNCELLSLRILLIDQYRKIILSDPHLPSELLPESWNGVLAHEITAHLFKQIKDKTDREFLSLLDVSDKKLGGDFQPIFSNRFSSDKQFG